MVQSLNMTVDIISNISIYIFKRRMPNTRHAKFSGFAVYMYIYLCVRHKANKNIVDLLPMDPGHKYASCGLPFLAKNLPNMKLSIGCKICIQAPGKQS